MILLISENKALGNMKGRRESQADREKSSPELLWEWQRCCEDSAWRQKDINSNNKEINKTSGLIQVCPLRATCYTSRNDLFAGARLA